MSKLMTLIGGLILFTVSFVVNATTLGHVTSTLGAHQLRVSDFELSDDFICDREVSRSAGEILSRYANFLRLSDDEGGQIGVAITENDEHEKYMAIVQATLRHVIQPLYDAEGNPVTDFATAGVQPPIEVKKEVTVLCMRDMIPLEKPDTENVAVYLGLPDGYHVEQPVDNLFVVVPDGEYDLMVNPVTSSSGSSAEKCVDLKAGAGLGTIHKDVAMVMGYNNVTDPLAVSPGKICYPIGVAAQATAHAKGKVNYDRYLHKRSHGSKNIVRAPVPERHYRVIKVKPMVDCRGVLNIGCGRQ